MTKPQDAIAFARAQEQLRQEQEAFDHEKGQNGRWFLLRLIVCYVSVVSLVAIMIVCVYVFFNSSRFPQGVVTAAGAAFFGDVLGLLTLVWKVVIGPGGSKPLRPVTRAS